MTGAIMPHSIPKDAAEPTGTAARVPRAMKLGYGIGDFAANIAFQSIALFYVFFLTDVFGISPFWTGIIFLVAKAWNAIFDPIMGYIVDHTRSRYGRKRPYLLFGAVPLGIIYAVLFFAPDLTPSDVSPYPRFIWGLVTFIIFSSVISAVNVPYGALTADLTLDTNERSNVTGYRMVFAVIGTLVAAGATKPLVSLFSNALGGTEAVGYRAVGFVYGAVIAVVTLITFVSVRERVAYTETDVSTTKATFSVIAGNKPFLILSAATICHITGVSTMAIVINYYFKYNLNAEDMIPAAFLCLFVTAIAFIPIFVAISKRISKKFAYNLGMGTMAASSVALFFFGGRGIPVTLAIFTVAGIGMATNYLSPWAMIPDTVEYSQWKTGLRREGIIYGFYFFTFKFSSALAGFLAGNVLAFTGYVANRPQTEAALLGIRTVLTLIPAVFIIVGIILIALFPITAEFHERMLADIRKREAGAEPLSPSERTDR
jgi:GPH family glycoside/pentoside/hexuronide:cation symporter